MRLSRMRLTTVLLAAGLALSPALATAQAKKTLRAGITDPLETPHGQAMVEFERVLEAETNGAIDVQLFPSNQLGSIVEQIQNVRDGGQEMSMSTPAWFSSFFPAIDLIEMPFFLTTWDQAGKIFASPAFAELTAKAQAASGIKIVGVFPTGFRNVINKRRPIAALADFKGLKIRLQNSPVHLATFKALGAVPVSVGWSETYQAVQNGVVDGLENASGILLSAKFTEVAKYVSETRHFFGSLLVYVNPSFYDKLTDSEKAAFAKAMRAAEAVNLRVAVEQENAAKEGLGKAGASVNALSPETQAELRKAVQPVYDEFGPKFQPYLDKLAAAGR